MSDAVISFLCRESAVLKSDELAILSSALSVIEYSPSSVQQVLQQLSLTLESSSFREVAPQLFVAWIHLAVKTNGQYVTLMLDALEKGSKHVDQLVHEVGKLYTKTNSPSLMLNAPVDALCNCLILLAILLSSSDFTAEAVLYFLDHNIYSTLSLLIDGFAKISGARPGYAPLLTPLFCSAIHNKENERIQIDILSKILSVMRQLASWKTHAFLEERETMPRKYKKAGPLSIVKASSSFRQYLITIAQQIMASKFLHELSVYFQILNERYGDAALDSYHRIAKECAVFLNNLLTLTGHCQSMLRSHILHSDIVRSLFIPFLCFHAINTKMDLSCNYSSVLAVSRAIGTFAFHSKGIQEIIAKKENILVKLCSEIQENVLRTSNTNENGTDTTQYVLLMHLTRIALNAKLSSFLPTLGKKWNSMDKKRKQLLFANVLFNGQHDLAPVESAGTFYEEFVNLIEINLQSIGDDERVFDVSTISKAPRANQKRRYARLRKKQNQQKTKELLFEESTVAVLGEEICKQRRDSNALTCGSESEEEKEEDIDIEEECLDLHIDHLPEAKDEIRVEDHLSQWRNGPLPTRIPIAYICALTHRLIQSVPVLSPEGYTFDRVAILSYLETNDKCPISGKPLKAEDLIVNEMINEKLQRLRESL